MITYFVTEIQNGTAITTAYQSKETAEQAFYTALSYAAVSDVKQHGAYLLDNTGNVLDVKFFTRDDD